MTLTLFHDYTSPASAVAVARLRRLSDRGVRADVVGIDAVGIDAVLPVPLDVLGELDAMAAHAAAEGLTLRRPSRLPPTALAHAVEDLAVGAGRADAWRRRCYDAFWRHDADLSDPAVLRALSDDAGLPPDAVDGIVADPLAVLMVRRRSAGARREGVGGVPTLIADRTVVPGLLDDDDLLALSALEPDAGDGDSASQADR